MIEVRDERPEDREQVRRIEEAAFGRADEADIVDALRGDPAWALSLVALVDGEPAGHLLLSRGSRAMTLGPLTSGGSTRRRGWCAASCRPARSRTRPRSANAAVTVV